MSDPRLDNTGENVSIAIADSITHPDDLDSDKIGDTHDYHSTAPKDPLGHGSKVYEVISHYVPDAEFSFYRIIGGNSKEQRRVRHLLDAINKARMYGVDVINVSSGTQFSPTSKSVSGFEIEKDLRRGIIVVSSCGNFIDDHVTGVSFPAIAPDVVGVGGYEPLCDCDPDEFTNSDQKGRYTFYSTSLSEANSQQDIYCAYQDYGDSECSTYEFCSLVETLWDGNVTPCTDPDKPDIFAPVKYPYLSERGLRQKIGTSYATPVITALIARVLNPIHDVRIPSSQEMRLNLKETGNSLTAGSGVKPNADALLESLEPPEQLTPFSIGSTNSNGDTSRQVED